MKSNLLQSKSNIQVDTLKAIAIISVICAHSNSVASQSSFSNTFVHYLLSIFGTIGVCIFFSTSGFLFQVTSSKNLDFKQFLLRKIKGIVVPWIVCGTLVYLYVSIRKGGISIEAWGNFIIGKGSYLYFIPNLLGLYLISWHIWKRPKINFCLMLCSFLSNLLMYTGFFCTSFMYLNIFNWYIFWGLGLLVGQKTFRRNRYVEIGALTILAIVSIVVSLNHIWFHYWYPGFIVYAMMALMASLWVSDKLKVYNFLPYIGKQTLAIYLIHMPFAGIVSNLFGSVDFWFLTLLRPIVVLAISLVFIRLYSSIARKTSIQRFLLIIVGIK